jgi:hypothetical protein
MEGFDEGVHLARALWTLRKGRPHRELAVLKQVRRQSARQHPGGILSRPCTERVTSPNGCSRVKEDRAGEIQVTALVGKKRGIPRIVLDCTLEGGINNEIELAERRRDIVSAARELRLRRSSRIQPD